MSHGPIFIGGLDRSGKTPLRLALSSHPNIAMTRRTYMWPRFYGRYGDLRQPANFERCLAAMLSHPPMRMLHPDAERIRREFWQGGPSYARLFALFHQHYAEREGKPRWGDQTGLIERYADQIFAAYPGARMIHMLRDPRTQYTASAGQAGTRRLGPAVARWCYSVKLAARNQRRYGARYLVVRYETLVTQPEATLRHICAFLGEKFVASMLTLEGAMRFGDEEQEAPRARREAVRHASLDQACAPMSARELAFMQGYAGRLMAAYGYAPDAVRLEWRERVQLYALDWPANLARLFAWRCLETLQHRLSRSIALRPLGAPS